MRILMLAVNDPAGCAMAFARAVNRHTAHVCRLATLETRYRHAWDRDLHLPDMDADGLDALRDLLAASDVFHFHMTADENLAFGPLIPKDYLAGKLVVHHHHGHPDFRAHPEKYREKYRRLGRDKLLVSTPDLLRLLPEAAWLPNLVPVDDPRYLPATDRFEPPVAVCHSPTNKALKNTAEFLAAMAELAGRGLQVRQELLDDVPHDECLARKRRCHILFDHLQGYYGVSSLEGLSQGLAVVAGLDDWCQGHLREFAGGRELPWVTSAPGSLAGDLAALVRDRERREALGAAGRRFMEEVLNDRRLALKLAAFYQA